MSLINPTADLLPLERSALVWICDDCGGMLEVSSLTDLVISGGFDPDDEIDAHIVPKAVAQQLAWCECVATEAPLPTDGDADV